MSKIPDEDEFQGDVFEASTTQEEFTNNAEFFKFLQDSNNARLKALKEKEALSIENKRLSLIRAQNKVKSKINK